MTPGELRPLGEWEGFRWGEEGTFRVEGEVEQRI